MQEGPQPEQGSQPPEQGTQPPQQRPTLPPLPPLHAAVFGRSLEIPAMLAAGVDINLIEPTAGLTALHIALGMKYEAAVRTLIEHPVNLDQADQRGNKPFAMASVDANLLAIMLDKFPDYINVPCNTRSEFPVHVAARTGNHAAVSLLVARRAALNVKDIYQKTPLFEAAQAGHIENVLTLIRAGVDVEECINRAIQFQSITVLQTLSAAGVDFMQPLASGMTPLEIAVNTGLEDVTVFLLNQVESAVKQPLVDARETQESAMALPTQAELELIEELSQEYDLSVAEVQSTLVEISHTLAARYESERAQNPQLLPLAWDASIGADLRYLTHKTHTAWRYLQRPNPWIAPDVVHAEKNAQNISIAAESTAVDQKVIVGLWRKAEREGGLDVVIDMLSDFGRRHNQVEEKTENDKLHIAKYKDDQQPDKPICASGISKSVGETLRLLPSCAERVFLTADDFKQRFEEQVVSQGASGQDTLYERLSGLTAPELRALKGQLEEVIIMHDMQAKLPLLEVSPVQLDCFMEGCKLHYGALQWSRHAQRAFKIGDMQYQSYREFAQELAEQVALHSGTRLITLMNCLIESKEKPPITFSEQVKQSVATAPEPSVYPNAEEPSVQCVSSVACSRPITSSIMR